jgi:hypothetical protein
VRLDGSKAQPLKAIAAYFIYSGAAVRIDGVGLPEKSGPQRLADASAHSKWTSRRRTASANESQRGLVDAGRCRRRRRAETHDRQIILFTPQQKFSWSPVLRRHAQESIKILSDLNAPAVYLNIKSRFAD